MDLSAENDIGDVSSFMDRLRQVGRTTIESGLNPFFQRLKEFKEGSVSEQRYDAFIVEFDRIKRSLLGVRERARAEDRLIAQSYSVFEVLGVETFEVSTHSSFLGNLLSHGGSHAQGDLFLRRFVEVVVPPSKRPLFSGLEPYAYEVVLEKATGIGYIDILSLIHI